MSNFVRHLIVKKYARLESPKLSIITLKNYTPLRSAGSNETKTKNTEKETFSFSSHHHRSSSLREGKSSSSWLCVKKYKSHGLFI